MEQDRSIIFKNAMQAGLYVGVAAIIYNLLLYISGVEYYNPFSSASYLPFLSFVILFAGMLYFSKKYRDDILGGYISYGNAVGYGVLIAFFYSVIVITYSWVFTKFIDPDIEATIRDLTEQYMLDQGMKESQVEKVIAMQDKMQGAALIISLVVYTFFGLILSLISSAFVKKEQSILEYEEEDVLDN